MSDLRIHDISFSGDSMLVGFSDGRCVTVPIASFPQIQNASPNDRAQWQLIGRGLGVHWEVLDEDLSVENILLAYSRTKSAEYELALHA